MATVTMISQPASARMSAQTQVPARTGMRALVFGLLSWLAGAQSRAASRYDLQDLDARQLRDVGLTRAEIDRALGATFWTIR